MSASEPGAAGLVTGGLLACPRDRRRDRRTFGGFIKTGLANFFAARKRLERKFGAVQLFPRDFQPIFVSPLLYRMSVLIFCLFLRFLKNHIDFMTSRRESTSLCVVAQLVQKRITVRFSSYFSRKP